MLAVKKSSFHFSVFFCLFQKKLHQSKYKHVLQPDLNSGDIVNMWIILFVHAMLIFGKVAGRLSPGAPVLFANGDPSSPSQGAVDGVARARSGAMPVPNAVLRLRGGSKARRIVVLGPPGSGKGTLCAEMVRELGAVHLSSGDLLRDAIKRGSPLIDEDTRKIVESGGLVRDDVVTSIVMSRLLEDAECSRRGWILDGYPRTAVQAKKLMERQETEPDLVILLDVDKQIILDRILGRMIDPVTGTIYHTSYLPKSPEILARLVRRADDQQQFFERRYEEYVSNIDAIRSVFGPKLHSIKGGSTINITMQQVLKLLSELRNN
jgi:adenylate kinase